MQRYVIVLTLAGGLMGLLGSCKSSKPTVERPRSGQPARSQVQAADRQRAEARYIDATTLMIRGDNADADTVFQEVLELMPENHAALYNRSRLALKAERTDEAVRLARAALKADPSNYWYYVQLRRSHELRGEYNQAIEVQQRLVNRFDDRPRERLHLADLYLRSNQPRQAIEALDALEQRVGSNEETVRRRYDIYRNLDQHEEALAVARGLTDMRPDELYYFQLVYRELKALDRNEEGAELLKELLERQPDNGFALLSLADYYKDQGQIEQSDAYLFRAFKNPDIGTDGKLTIINNLLQYARQPSVLDRAKRLTAIFLETHPDEAGGYNAQGRIFLAQGQLDSARYYLRQGLDREPAKLSGWIDLIQLSYAQQQFEQMYEDAEEAMGYFPNQDQVLFFHGVASSQVGKARRGISSLEKLIRVGSAPPSLITQAHAELGRVYHEQGAYSESDRNFEAALDREPKNALVLNNYAYYLSLRSAKLDQAQEMAEQALKLSPDQPSYLDTYGWVLYQQGDYEQAEKFLRKALEKGATSAEVLEHHGDALFKLGRRDEAIERWQQAQEAGATFDVDDKLAQ